MKIKLREDETLGQKVDDFQSAQKKVVGNTDLIKDALDDAYRVAKRSKALIKGTKATTDTKTYVDDPNYVPDDAIKNIGIWDASFEETSLENEDEEENYNYSSGVTWPNVLLVGGAGVGKTARVKAWAKEKGVTVVVKLASSLERVDMGGVQTPVKIKQADGSDKYVAARLSPVEFDALDDDNSVLFLDEFNRANSAVRGAMLTLINDHVCVDSSSPTGMKELDFLFTIAAINPGSGGSDYNTDELDTAERSRFRTVKVAPETAVTFNYYRKSINEKMTFNILRLKKYRNVNDFNEIVAYKNKLDLLDALENANFTFDDDADDKQMEAYRTDETWNHLITTPRSFEALLDVCDGTKDSLFKYWNSYCNNLNKSTWETALTNWDNKYEKLDKANAALGSTFAKKTSSASQGIASRLTNASARWNH